MYIPKEVQRQLRKGKYLTQVYGWKLDENGNRYQDRKAMQEKLDYLNWRHKAILTRGTAYANYDEYIKIVRQIADLNIALGNTPFQINLPISYQVTQTVEAVRRVSYEEVEELINDRGFSDIFQDLEDKLVKNIPNYHWESFTVLGISY